MENPNKQLLNELINKAKELDKLLLKAKQKNLHLLVWTSEEKIYIDLKEHIKF